MRRKASKRQDSRRVELQSGGTVTVILNCSVFDLTMEDRDFVTRMIDMVRDYEAVNVARASKPDGSPSKAEVATGTEA
ncbi:MAG: hypothetical protein OEV40_00720 [Acidimicrobiia bacterium]|nr:hypothetical protein [Acidimicrobiia bacterium]